MDNNIKINLSLTLNEANSIKTIYDKLVDIDLFKDIDSASYSALDKLIKAVNTEVGLQEMLAKNNFAWGEKCQFCGHSSTSHAQNGTGLCCQESCNCFTMIHSGVAF